MPGDFTCISCSARPRNGLNLIQLPLGGGVQPHSAPVAFIACYNVIFWIVPSFTMLFNLDYARNLAREGKFREALSVYSVSARQSGPNMDVVR